MLRKNKKEVKHSTSMDYFTLYAAKFQWPGSYGFPELKAMCTSLFLIAVSGHFLHEFVQQLFAPIYPFGFQNFLWQLSYTIKLCLFALFWFINCFQIVQMGSPLVLALDKIANIHSHLTFAKIVTILLISSIPPLFFLRLRIYLFIFTILFCKIGGLAHNIQEWADQGSFTQ